MRTPSLYVGIVQDFSVAVIGLHYRICITIYVIIYIYCKYIIENRGI